MTFVILLYCHQTEKGKEWENNFNFQKWTRLSELNRNTIFELTFLRFSSVDMYISTKNKSLVFSTFLFVFQYSSCSEIYRIAVPT